MARFNMVEFLEKQNEVTMKTPPTLLVEIAFKLGITKPGEDKEKLVEKINKKLTSFKKTYGIR